MADEKNPGGRSGEGQRGQDQNRPNEQEQQQEKRRAPGSGEEGQGVSRNKDAARAEVKTIRKKKRNVRNMKALLEP